MILQIVFLNLPLFIFFIQQASAGGHPGIATTFIGLQNENNLGHSGYIYLSTDAEIPDFQLSPCQNIDINETTCDFISNRTISDSMIIRSWVAATVRDNILTFLSYLAHQKSDIFIENIDDSLNIIYEQVRKNNIKTIDLLPQLTSIAKLNKSSQFVALFKVLEQVMPPFCRSALETLSQFFSKMKYSAREHLFITMKSKKRDIDLYSDIGFQVIPSLRLKSKSRHFDKVIAASLGQEFAILFSAIQDGKIMLTQPVLAALMLNMRFSELTPDENEDLRFIIDILRSNKITKWSPGFSGSANIKCPYELVRRMMKVLSDLSDIDLRVSEIAERLATHLKKPIRSNVVKEMDKFFSNEQLNISLLFETLRNSINILEVKTLKEMVENGTISLSYALKGFNRYFYDTPEKLLIALIQRIKLRTPMSESVLGIVNKVVNRLKDHNITSENPSQSSYPSKEISMIGNRYTDSYDHGSKYHKHDDFDDDPRIIRNKRNKFGDKASESRNESLKYEYVPELGYYRFLDDKPSTFSTSLNINDTSTSSKCPKKIPKRFLSAWLMNLSSSAVNTNPVLLIANVSTFLASFMKDPEINYLIKNILHKLVDEENIKKHNSTENSLFNESPLVAAANRITPKHASVNTTHHQNNTGNQLSSPIITFNGTKQDLLKKLLIKMLSIKKVRARRLIYYEVIRLYCILQNGLENHTTDIFSANHFSLDGKPDNASLTIFLESISPTFKNVIMKLNSKGRLLTVKLKYYKTNRLFIIQLCKFLISQKEVKKNKTLFNEIVYLLHSIYDFQMRFAELIKFNVSKTSNESLESQLIFDLLVKPGLLQLLNIDFDLGLYPKKGFMLKAILETVMRAPEVKKNISLLNAIKNYIPKITCTEREAEPVIEMLKDVLSDQVDVRKVIEYGLDETKLLPDVQEAFKNMWYWYGASFDPIIFMKTKLNISLYDTRAEFIEGFLDTVEADVDNDFIKVKSDIRLMKSAILKTGKGREPVDYV